MTRPVVSAIVLLLCNTVLYADIVYTTANTANTQSNTNVPSQPSAQSQGYVLGRFITNNMFSFYDNAVIRFNTGSSNNLNFSGIRWNSFLDDHAGSSSSGITGGSFLWTLFNNQNGSTSTFSQQLRPVVHPGTSNYSPNVYQDGAWTLLTGSNILSSSTDYTLALTGLNITSTTGVLSIDELHWTYSTSGAAGGAYNVLATGSMATPSGTGTITPLNPLAPGVGFAYDINATAIPEPSTLFTSTVLMVLVGIGFGVKKVLF